MATTRTGTYGSSGQSTHGEPHAIGITMQEYEYPTKVQFSEDGYWQTSVGTVSFYLYLCDTAGNNAHLLENFSISGDSTGHKGPWNVSNGIDLCNKALAISFTSNGSFRNVTTVTVTTNIRTFTITWKQDNGVTIATENVNGGATPTRTGPTKDPDTQYNYTFDKWYPTPVPASADATYTATYTKTKRSYTISTSVTPAGAGTITAPQNGASVQWGTSVQVAQTPANGYVFDEWTGATVRGGAFDMPTGDVDLVAKYKLHTLIWTDPTISISQNEYELTVTKGGYATDNAGESISYYVYMDGVPAVQFPENSNTVTITLTDEQLETEIVYAIVAQTSITANGASLTYEAVSVHKTVKYYDGEAWVTCYMLYYDGEEWQEVIPYYYDGNDWVLCSQT